MIENPLENKFHRTIVGLDEAGRGPMAGPLVVAGVVFPDGYTNPELDDSKRLSEKKRERLFAVIKQDAVWYDIEFVDEQTIDMKNIYRADQEAMFQIAKAAPADIVLTDAMPLDGLQKHVESIIKGDHKSISIAAASILAKVSRDHYMYHLDALYPQYGFAKHKGYPTKQHKEALRRFGVLPCHRRSYAPVKEQLEPRLF